MVPTRPISRVVVLMAMEAEAQQLISALNLQRDRPSKLPDSVPCTAFSGHLEKLEVTIVTAGKCKDTAVDNVGTVPAAIATYAAISTFHPDLLINAGTAGGFLSNESKIGDVYLSIACVNHDRRLKIPGYEVYGTGRISSVATVNLSRHLGLKTGVVSTGNSLDYTDQCMKIMKQNAAAAKDMEAAAIAWVASLFGTPFFCVKAITDLVDGERPPEKEFLENLQGSATALKAAMIDILHFVAGKGVDEL